jgi:hypothetical protein
MGVVILKSILGLDPGKKSGYALITVENKVIKPGPFGEEDNSQVTEIGELILLADIVVCEDFKLRPDKARRGAFDYSTMVAPQVIGKIELLCEMSNTILAKQQPSVKPVAYGFAGLKYVPGKKGTHWQDAYCHAVYYAVTKLNAFPVGHGVDKR